MRLVRTPKDIQDARLSQVFGLLNGVPFQDDDSGLNTVRGACTKRLDLIPLEIGGDPPDPRDLWPGSVPL